MTADFRSLLFCIVGKEQYNMYVALLAIFLTMYPAEVRLNDSTFKAQVLLGNKKSAGAATTNRSALEL